MKYDSFKEYLQLNYLGVINNALEEWIQENELNEFESYIVNNIKVTGVKFTKSRKDKVEFIVSLVATYDLVEKAVASAKARNVRYHVGQVLASDIFYAPYGEEWKKWAQMGVLGVEMESYALYCNAAFLGKEALTILTVSDSFVDTEITTAEERQKTFTAMMEIALDLI